MWDGIHRVHTIVGGWRLRISRILFWWRSEVVITRACHARIGVSNTPVTAKVEFVNIVATLTLNSQRFGFHLLSGERTCYRTAITNGVLVGKVCPIN